MRSGGGKQKGSAFERSICKDLSLWVSHGAREDLFWRSAMSGGRATVGRRKGKDLAQAAGDITATHPAGHVLTDYFYIECKRYKDLKLGHLVSGIEKGLLVGFWQRAMHEAQLHHRVPMLIIRQDFGQTMMMLPAPHMLTRGAGFMFNYTSCIARLHMLKVDLYAFDKVLSHRFEMPAADPFASREFLKPGEIARFEEEDRLKREGRKARKDARKAERVRITVKKERVRIKK